jgi:hypothetical protein
MPRSKQSNKDGVCQLSFTFGFFPKDDAQETEGNSPPASIQSISVQSQLSPGRVNLMESRMREIRTYGSGREVSR